MTNNPEDLERLASEGQDFLFKELGLGKVDLRFFGRISELKQDARVEDVEPSTDPSAEFKEFGRTNFEYDVDFKRSLEAGEFRDLLETYFGTAAWSNVTTYGDRNSATMDVERKTTSYRLNFYPVTGLE